MQRTTCPNISKQLPGEVPPYMGPIQTAYVDENVCSSQNPSPNVEGSHSSQRTSFGNQTPYEDVSMDSSGSFVSQSHALQSFSVSTSDQAQPPRQKSDMEAHHSVAQKKFFCPYQDCEKSYTRSYHLKDHLKKHRGEKPFVCNQPGCQWRFFRSEDLRRHQSKHSGMRQYPCAKCNKNFSRLSYLKQHQRICTQAGPSARNWLSTHYSFPNKIVLFPSLNSSDNNCFGNVVCSW